MSPPNFIVSIALLLSATLAAPALPLAHRVQDSPDSPDVHSLIVSRASVVSASAANAASAAHSAGDNICIDDTRFKQFTSPTSFVVQSCPKGFCFTRKPPLKNPCVGKANAQRIDG